MPNRQPPPVLPEPAQERTPTHAHSGPPTPAQTEPARHLHDQREEKQNIQTAMQNQRCCVSTQILGPLAISSSRAQVSGSSLEATQHVTQDKLLGPPQPNPVPGAAVGTLCSGNPPGLHPKAEEQNSLFPAQTCRHLFPKLIVTSRGLGGRGVSPSGGAKQKANAKLSLCAGLASLPRRAAPAQSLGRALGTLTKVSKQSPKPNLSCPQEGMDGFGGTVPWDRCPDTPPLKTEGGISVSHFAGVTKPICPLPPLPTHLRHPPLPPQRAPYLRSPGSPLRFPLAGEGGEGVSDPHPRHTGRWEHNAHPPLQLSNLALNKPARE